MDNRDLDFAVPETQSQFDGDDLDADEDEESIVPVETLKFVTITYCVQVYSTEHS